MPTTKKPWTISMPAFLAFETAVSISWSVCSFLRRSRIFWLPLSIPNMMVRQPDFASLGKRCCATESTRPSRPYLILFLIAISPSHIASMREERRAPEHEGHLEDAVHADEDRHLDEERQAARDRV